MTVIMEEGWWNAQTARAYLASPILRQFVGRLIGVCPRAGRLFEQLCPTRIIHFLIATLMARST